MRQLKKIVDEAHAELKPVSVCGELAGNPMGAGLLLAMGYDSLSMNATNLPKVKSIIRGISKEWSEQLLAEVLTMESGQVIASTMQLMLEKAGFGRIIGPSVR